MIKPKLDEGFEAWRDENARYMLKTKFYGVDLKPFDTAVWAKGASQSRGRYLPVIVNLLEALESVEFGATDMEKYFLKVPKSEDGHENHLAHMAQVNFSMCKDRASGAIQQAKEELK